MLNDLGRHEEALANYEAALAIRQRVLPEDHPDIAKTRRNLQRCQEKLAKHK
ncbi:tetratricopeptide repeat protein [Candidatus Electronema sp. PJ]|uniref:tetratricopeptide repeat protein n=1 Tax=Candidatus Electronema sp. PJ TaxID=3401572 RepID=UPI003AA891BC